MITYLLLEYYKDKYDYILNKLLEDNFFYTR